MVKLQGDPILFDFYSLSILTARTLTPQRQSEVYESDILARHRQILRRPREDIFAEIQIRNSHRSHELIELLLQARFQTSIHAF